MSAERLSACLSEVETLLDEMAILLVRGDAPALEAAATTLRNAMAELAHTGGRTPHQTFEDAALRARLQQVAQALVRQRDNVARRAVVVARGLAAVLPPQDVTYGSPGRAGVFRGSVARIYQAPAN